MSETARRLGISRNTASKFKTGDPKELCQYGIQQSKLDIYKEQIICCLNEGYSKSKTIACIKEHGYKGGSTNAYDYLKKIEDSTGINFEPQLHTKLNTKALKNNVGSTGDKTILLLVMEYSAIFG